MQRVGNKAKGTQRVGSRAQVMHGNAKQTGGGLKKKDLKYNKQGKIVSKKMSAMAKKEKRLQKAGWVTQKGVFGAVRTMKGGVKSCNDICYKSTRVNPVRERYGYPKISRKCDNDKSILTNCKTYIAKKYTLYELQSIRIRDLSAKHLTHGFDPNGSKLKKAILYKKQLNDQLFTIVETMSEDALVEVTRMIETEGADVNPTGGDGDITVYELSRQKLSEYEAQTKAAANAKAYATAERDNWATYQRTAPITIPEINRSVPPVTSLSLYLNQRLLAAREITRLSNANALLLADRVREVITYLDKKMMTPANLKDAANAKAKANAQAQAEAQAKAQAEANAQAQAKAQAEAEAEAEAKAKAQARRLRHARDEQAHRSRIIIAKKELHEKLQKRFKNDAKK
jgi:hypothetical protein